MDTTGPTLATMQGVSVKNLFNNETLDEFIDTLLGFDKTAPIVREEPSELSMQIEALSCWTKRKLEPALLELLFAPDNYRSYTREQLCKELKFIHSLVFPYFIHQRASVRINKILFDVDLVKQESAKANIIRDAKKFLTLLSRRLGEHESFFPPATTTHADIVIYTYLSRILAGEWIDRDLATHIRGCGNLLKFMKHFALKNQLVDVTIENSANSENDVQDGITAYTVPLMVAAMACVLFASLKGVGGGRR